MKKVIKGFGALVCILLILSLIPSEFSAKKSITINKSQEEVAAYVKDFSNYNQWNPWFKLDPNMEVKVEEKTYTWNSTDDKVGAGSQTLSFESDDSLSYNLRFTAPMENTAQAYILFKTVEGGTEVSWGFKSEGNVLVGLIFDPSEMVGNNYAEGLATLKKKLEE